MDFLIGLSQGMTQGLLGRQRQEQQDFYKQQDLLVDQLHRDASKVRPEDYPKMLAVIHQVTTAKNPKQLNEAWGAYTSQAMAEDYERERQDREFNANIPTERVVPGESYSPSEDSRPREVTSSVPGANVSYAPPRAIQLESQVDAIPEDQRQPQRDPNAYAQGKIRFISQEGQQGRQIELLEKKGKIQTEAYLAREKAKGQARLREIQEKAKSAGLKGIRYGYDDEGNLMMMGVNAKGESVQENLGAIKLPQSIIAEANNKSRAELQEERLRADREKFDLQLKDTQARTAIMRQEAQLRQKEINEKIKAGYYGSGGQSNAAARNLSSVYKFKDDALETEIAGLQRQAQEAMQQMAFFPEQAKVLYDSAMEKLLAKEKERRQLGEQFSTSMEQISPIEKAPTTAEKAPAKSATAANKKPTLTVGGIKEAMGLKK